MFRPLLLLSLALSLAAQENALPDDRPGQTPAGQQAGTVPVPSASAPIPAAPAAPVEEILRPPEPGRFKPLFQPFRTDAAALSPDGRYLAYSVREGESLAVAVVEVARPEKMTALVRVVSDEAATSQMATGQREKTPGRINWLGWVSPTRVVVETNQVHATPGPGQDGWRSWSGTVLAFDADGTNARTLASAQDVPESMMNLADETGVDPFSTRRETRWKFLPSEPEAVSEDAVPLDGEPLDPEAPPDVPSVSASIAPRSLRLFDFDPARPGAVTLVASGAPRSNRTRSLAFYSLDPGSGKLTNLVDQLIDDERTPRIDRQGRVRLSLPASIRHRFPLAYGYHGPEGRNRARPLDEVTGLTGFSVSPDNYFAERAIPLGFDTDPSILYYASNVGRDTYGIYSFNLTTGRRGSLAIENPAHDLVEMPGAGFPDLTQLVFDRFNHQLAGVRHAGTFRTTAWLRPELQALQAGLERQFPGRSVELVDWDEAVEHVLVSTEGPSDPGAFFLYDRARNRLSEFVRRAPWIEANHANTTLPFAYTREDGVRLTGLITVPGRPRMKPSPLVIICPDAPWQRVRAGFQPELQALADMGFAVVQLNGRGAWGQGRRQRESLTAGYDLVQVDDIVTTLAVLGRAFAVNPRRVALLGRGHGGFIALRALQEHPDKFRCAVVLEAPIDLADWLETRRWSDADVGPHLTRAWLGDDARLAAAPLARRPEAVTRPVLMLSHPGPDGAPRLAAYAKARQFAAAVRRHGTPVEFADLHPDYLQGFPAARAEVFDRIEGFLNEHIYDYKVKMRDIEILPDKK